jgi:acetylornithine deacetylase/succinyl-diaminopimelate desuccinylase-like protein
MNNQGVITAMTHDLAECIATIDRQRQSFLDRLFAYLRMPSISAYGEGMDVVADYLVHWLQEMGFAARLVATPGWPMLLAQRTDQPSAPTVLLYGHYDVQPPDPLEQWLSPPFEPTLRNGRIYARGVGDNKGQHFAQLLALETLLAAHGRLPCNVMVLLEGEEEVGSPHIAHFVQEHRHELKADLVIVADGPVHASGQATLEFGVRGVVSFELRARGAKHDLHSGNWGGIAPNPIWTLVHLLASMKNAQGEITIAGFYDQVAPRPALVQATLDALPVDLPALQAELGLRELDAPQAKPFYDRLADPTFTINGLHGGYGGPRSKTVLSAEAVVKCDMRLVTNQRVEEILGKVAAHVQRFAPSIEFVPLGGMDPSMTPLDSPYAAPVQHGLAAGQGEAVLIVPAMGGSLPNYVFTDLLGLPTFVTPYANADEANHAPNENLEVERFFKGIKSGAAMLMEIAAYGKR